MTSNDKLQNILSKWIIHEIPEQAYSDTKSVVIKHRECAQSKQSQIESETIQGAYQSSTSWNLRDFPFFLDNRWIQPRPYLYQWKANAVWKKRYERNQPEEKKKNLNRKSHLDTRRKDQCESVARWRTYLDLLSGRPRKHLTSMSTNIPTKLKEGLGWIEVLFSTLSFLYLMSLLLSPLGKRSNFVITFNSLIAIEKYGLLVMIV